jgi:hypothetical protein
MRKLLLLVATVLFTLNISAQKQFAGILKLKMDLEGESIDASMKAQYPITSEMKVLNNKTRTDMGSGGFVFTIITDGDNNKNYQILDLSASSMGIYYGESPATNDKQKFDFQYDKNDKKTIAGLECYKVTCTVTDLETDEMQEVIMYISDDFLPDFKSTEFTGFKGFPLYTRIKGETDGSPYFQTTEVIEIKENKKIKPITFLLPSGAVPFDQMPAEVKAMFRMGNDDE